MYTVSQAAALTGIPTATLRAWERRYGVIAPRRTEGGYRLYDPAQIALLREMAARIEGGMRPAQAAASLTGPRKRAGSTGSPDLVAAAASLDPATLQATIEQAFAASAFALTSAKPSTFACSSSPSLRQCSATSCMNRVTVESPGSSRHAFPSQ